MAHLKHILPAAAVALLLSGPSFAAKPDMPPGQEKKISRAAPGPVAGVGLPVAAVAGGFIWWRNRRRKS
ncbi:MAG TPA: hypothetical protein VNS34_22025 [Rhizobiaceae bacterium]|nr:hypothetical protein [Rhizobiaceae bacterium]